MAHSQFTIHNSHGKSIVRARAAHAHRLEVPARGQWAAPIGQRQELPKGISRYAIARRRAEGADHVAAAAAVVGRADAGGIRRTCGRRGRRGEHVHACRGMHAGAEACVRVVKEASDVPKAQTQMTSLPQTLHAFH